MNLAACNSLTISTYNTLAKKYHHQFKDELNFKEYDKRILSSLADSLPPKSKICDAGCGPSGHIGRFLFEKGHEIIGIDISTICIEIASNYQKCIDFHYMDMGNTSFESEYFNAVISFYSIIHTPSQFIPKIFDEFHRILKTEGKLLIVVKKGREEGFIKGDWYDDESIYFTHFLEDQLKELVVESGFKVEFLETRKANNEEITIDRIFLLATKQQSN